MVYQSNGERITYIRDPRYDSRNRRFLGYYNTTLARILRFPASGSGRMQTADLDDPIVAYTTTRRIVRPVRAGGDWLPPVIPGPVFVPPPILPGYGIDPGPMIYAPNTQVFPSVAPQSVVLESKVVPKPDLPPAMVTLRNGGPRELQVTIVDNSEPGRTQSIRLAPNASDTLRLIRDAGATRIEKVRVDSLATGDSATEEIESDLPPQSRYRIFVHEIRLQSIAIDRTPGGNNAIEDINQTGIGIGQFDLPPGPELQSGTIDVYAAAKSQGNARSIAPILATEDDEFAPDPLEQAIIDARQR
ncbi:hypothetical protein [Rubripirellula obstinata]|uniref:hypothetical protein n=1 Tax=Rubripirellula obstinata TaxID=406547 RepID=UPI00122C5970|nr:hypothetical protein [Rubripirellula obstinata]